MKSISKILILILVSMMLLTSCETDDKKEENKATAPATATVTATADSTETCGERPLSVVIKRENVTKTSYFYVIIIKNKSLMERLECLRY